jgi:hypothetical protein
MSLPESSRRSQSVGEKNEEENMGEMWGSERKEDDNENAITEVSSINSENQGERKASEEVLIDLERRNVSINRG